MESNKREFKIGDFVYVKAGAAYEWDFPTTPMQITYLDSEKNHRKNYNSVACFNNDHNRGAIIGRLIHADISTLEKLVYGSE